MTRPFYSVAVGFLVLLASLSVNASPITINSSFVRAFAYDGSSVANAQDDTSTAFGARSLLAVAGAYSSAVDLNWVDTGSGALIDFDIGQTRAGNQGGYADVYEAYFNFTADVDTTYSISGQYTADDVGNGGRLYSNVFLRDLTAGSTMLFQDFTESRSTVDESFTLGTAALEGDKANVLQGSLTGNLIAGNEYQFFFEYLTHAYQVADDGTTTTGCVTLSIGGAGGAGSCGISASVPEPMPLTLLGLGLAFLGLRRWSYAGAA